MLSQKTFEIGVDFLILFIYTCASLVSCIFHHQFFDKGECAGSYGFQFWVTPFAKYYGWELPWTRNRAMRVTCVDRF